MLQSTSIYQQEKINIIKKFIKKKFALIPEYNELVHDSAAENSHLQGISILTDVYSIFTQLSLVDGDIYNAIMLLNFNVECYIKITLNYYKFIKDTYENFCFQTTCNVKSLGVERLSCHSVYLLWTVTLYICYGRSLCISAMDGHSVYLLWTVTLYICY